MWLEINGSLINLTNVIRIDKTQCMNQFALEFYYEQDRYTRVVYKTEALRNEEFEVIAETIKSWRINNNA